ncbi:hypothetical protein SAMN06265377_0114 [Flagellimonas pacifica]|uniref:Uncharacterized protein n=1 Tax=Flagellimonas pacifica TaxID=1247520 RepID=A0A285MER4_9FLAO|nr:hypothetical protein SAMN06265377_0114 [Allomuricauda parva]
MGFEVTKVYQFFDFGLFEKLIAKKYPAKNGIFNIVIAYFSIEPYLAYKLDFII